MSTWRVVWWILLQWIFPQTESLTKCTVFKNNYCNDLSVEYASDCVYCVYAFDSSITVYNKPTCMKPGMTYFGKKNINTLCDTFDVDGFLQFKCCKFPDCKKIDDAVLKDGGKYDCKVSKTTMPTTKSRKPTMRPTIKTTKSTPTTRTTQTTKLTIKTVVTKPTTPAPTPKPNVPTVDPGGFPFDMITKWPVMRCYGYQENGTVVTYHMCYGCVITTVYRRQEKPWLDCIRPHIAIYEPYSYFCNQYFLDNHIMLYVTCCYTDLCNKAYFNAAFTITISGPLQILQTLSLISCLHLLYRNNC